MFSWKRIAVAGVATLLLLVAGWFGWQTISLNRARENLKKVEELAKAERNFAAYDLALDIQPAAARR